MNPYHHPKPQRLHAGHVRRIRTYLNGGISVSETARLAGVSHVTISHISRGLWPRVKANKTTSAHGRG